MKRTTHLTMLIIAIATVVLFTGCGEDESSYAAQLNTENKDSGITEVAEENISSNFPLIPEGQGYSVRVKTFSGLSSLSRDPSSAQLKVLPEYEKFINSGEYDIITAVTHTVDGFIVTAEVYYRDVSDTSDTTSN